MPFAIFRKYPQHDELGKLAEEHMNHDLEQSDRDAIVKAVGSISMPTTLGTLLGLGLGVYAAFRLRRVRADMFNAFRATEKPTHVLFSNGRQGMFHRFVRRENCAALGDSRVPNTAPRGHPGHHTLYAA